MENFLRLSVKINNILCILIVLLSGLSYLVDMRKDKDVASWGIGVSLTFCVFLIILSLIAKRGLTLMIRDDDNIKAYKVMRAGIVFAGCLMAFFILGLAIGISTGMVSYLYILLILATGFYLFCMLKVRPPKPDVLGGGEGKEYAELCCRPEDHQSRIGKQWPEITHRADADKQQKRKQFIGNACRI